jgi:hypothetical protein
MLSQQKQWRTKGYVNWTSWAGRCEGVVYRSQAHKSSKIYIDISLLFVENEKRIRHERVTYVCVRPLTAISPPIYFLVTRRREIYVCLHCILNKKDWIEMEEWLMYEDGTTIILISLAHDMRQSHGSPHLRTRWIIIADFIYIGPDECIGCPRKYFTFIHFI